MYQLRLCGCVLFCFDCVSFGAATNPSPSRKQRGQSQGGQNFCTRRTFVTNQLPKSAHLLTTYDNEFPQVSLLSIRVCCRHGAHVVSPAHGRFRRVGRPDVDIACTCMQNFGGVPVHDASEHSVVVHGSGASLGHC